MDESDALAPRGKPRWGTLALVVLFHLLVLAGLTRAFAPDFAASAIQQATAVLTVTISAPEDEPSPPPDAPPEPDEGTAGDEGRKATPRPTSATPARLPVKPAPPAPRATSTGAAAESGARDQGEGTGGSVGAGTGSGHSGDGQGTGPGGARKLEKIAGDINSSKDYPKGTRDLRVGHSVTILLTVGADGTVQDCSVTEASPDAEADRITCRLASERFRFRPATDAQGQPAPGKYAWRQRWFY